MVSPEDALDLVLLCLCSLMAVAPSPLGDDEGECEYLVVVALITSESVTMHFLDFKVVSRAGKGCARNSQGKEEKKVRKAGLQRQRRQPRSSADAFRFPRVDDACQPLRLSE
jgi:hypothetical protein